MTDQHKHIPTAAERESSYETKPHRIVDTMNAEITDLRARITELEAGPTERLQVKGKNAAGWYVAWCETSEKLKAADACIERYRAALAPQPIKVEPTDEWIAYATRSGLLNERGVAPNPMQAQTAWFAFTYAWNRSYEFNRAALAAIQPTAAPPVTPKHIEEIKDILLWPVTEDDARTARDMLQSLHFDLSMAESNAAAIQPAAPQEPVSPTWPAYGIIDPDYARYYSIIRCTAWSYGYAIGMHGSFTRDLDLIMVPWTDEARDATHVMKVIASRTDLRLHSETPGTKPHGRVVFTFHLPGFGDPRWIDLSVMPKLAEAITRPTAPDAAAVRDAERYRYLRKMDSEIYITTGDLAGDGDCDPVPAALCGEIADKAIDRTLAASPAATKEPQ